MGNQRLVEQARKSRATSLRKDARGGAAAAMSRAARPGRALAREQEGPPPRSAGMQRRPPRAGANGDRLARSFERRASWRRHSIRSGKGPVSVQLRCRGRSDCELIAAGGGGSFGVGLGRKTESSRGDSGMYGRPAERQQEAKGRDRRVGSSAHAGAPLYTARPARRRDSIPPPRRAATGSASPAPPTPFRAAGTSGSCRSRSWEAR